jgi:anti-sigma factor RsiW
MLRARQRWGRKGTEAKSTDLLEELHAYLHGRLDVRRRAQVEARIRFDQDLRRLLEEYRAQAVHLELLGRLTRLSPPPRNIEALRDRFAHKLRRRQRMVRGFKTVAAVAVAAALVGTGQIGWLHYGTGEGPLVAVTRQATEAYRLSSLESELSDAEGGSHILGWLAQQVMGKNLPTPDLQSLGFQLAGSRVLPTSRGPAAQLFYEGSDGERVMLYLTANVGQRKSGFTFASEGELSMFYWQSGPFIYSLIGRMEQDQLLEVAELINAELSSASSEAGQAVETPEAESTDDGGATPATTPAHAPEASNE